MTTTKNMPEKTATKSKVVTAKKTTTSKVKNLPSNPFVFEVLDLVSKQRSNAKKVEVLKKYEDVSIKALLIWNFDESVISMIPEGEVPYADAEDQMIYSGSFSNNISKEASGGESATGQDLDGRGRTSLRREWVNLYHYIKGGNDSLSKTRREMMFINLLQGLHPKEAELLVLVKDKLLTNKYKLTRSIVEKAYPDITWGNRS